MKNATVNGETRTIIAIGIRGGNYGAEWSGNTKLSESGEAQGFATARDQVVAFLNSYLENHRAEITSQPKIWLCGFSRASATANLTANFINYAMENRADKAAAGRATAGSTDYSTTYANMVQLCTNLERLDARQSDLFCYGFEVPAGGVKKGDGGWNAVAEDNGNIWNQVNDEDLVTLVAPKLWGFVRYGNDINLTGKTAQGLHQQAAVHVLHLGCAGLQRRLRRHHRRLQQRGQRPGHRQACGACLRRRDPRLARARLRG